MVNVVLYNRIVRDVLLNKFYEVKYFYSMNNISLKNFNFKLEKKYGNYWVSIVIDNLKFSGVFYS